MVYALLVCLEYLQAPPRCLSPPKYQLRTKIYEGRVGRNAADRSVENENRISKIKFLRASCVDYNTEMLCDLKEGLSVWVA